MQSLSFMSREQLVHELIAPPALFSSLSVAEARTGNQSIFAANDAACVQHKLAVAREILLRDLCAPLTRSNLLHSPDTVREWLTLHYCQAEHEIFTVLYLDVKLRLIRADDLFAGTLTHTSVYPREVVKQALSQSAASVIVAHNHPSGMCEPSEADRVLTRSLADALGLVDIRLLDHFVVGCDQVYSFAEHGLL